MPILPLLVMIVVLAMVSMLIVAVAVLTPLVATSDGGIGPDFVGLYIGLVYIGSMAATQPQHSHRRH